MNIQKTKNRFSQISKTFMLIILAILLTGTSLAVSSDIQFNEGEEVFIEENFEVSWTLENAGSEDLEVDTSFIEITYNDATYYEFIEESIMVGAGNTETRIFEVSDDELESEGFENGEWEIYVMDTWEDSGEGDDQTEDVVTIDAKFGDSEFYDDDPTEEEVEPDGEVSLEIDSVGSYNRESDLEVSWNSFNDYNVDQMLETTEVRVEDNFGVSETQELNREISVDSSNSQSGDASFSKEDLDGLVDGEWKLFIADTWEHDSAENYIYFSVGGEEEETEEEEEEDNGDDGDLTGPGDDEDESEDLSASASSDLSTADVGDEFEFDGSDSTGEIDSFEWSFDDGNAETGEMVTHSFEEEGTYEVELEISLNDQSDTDTVTVEVEEGAEQQETTEDEEEETDEEETEDTETEDETETTDEDTDEDTTDDELAPPADDEEAHDNETEETGEETETDDECPEGFAYDEENDVCIESDDEDDGSVGALDTVTDPEVAGIPVWLITVLAAFAGLQAYWW